MPSTPIFRARYAAAKTIANKLGFIFIWAIFGSGLYAGFLGTIVGISGAKVASDILHYAAIMIVVSAPVLLAGWWRRLVKDNMRDMGY